MKKEITFTNVTGLEFLEKPMPSSSSIPDWYKKTYSYVGGKKIPSIDAMTLASVKKCVPVFDAITAGYIIKTTSDVYVYRDEHGLTNYQFSGYDFIKSHPREQAPIYPGIRDSDSSIPKFMNPWAIKTPKGYSCLFVQPSHRELPFTVLPGIVDTDKYHAPVNILFMMNVPDFEGYIPAGTPMVLVIPFKSESWKM